MAATTVNGLRVVDEPLQIASSCPGSYLRMIYAGEKEYFGSRTGGTLLRGDLFPETVGYYGTEEQKPENCAPKGFKPGTAPLTSSWFSPHDGITFPNVAIWTYYGAGLRAVDISNPFMLREAGVFINKPVERVRWASYGDQGSDVPGGPDGLLRMRPTATAPAVFAFSYAVVRLWQLSHRQPGSRRARVRALRTVREVGRPPEQLDCERSRHASGRGGVALGSTQGARGR